MSWYKIWFWRNVWGKRVSALRNTFCAQFFKAIPKINFTTTHGAAVQQVNSLTVTSAAFCAKPSDRSGRSCAHSPDTGMVWPLCVCGNASSAHQTGRTSMCSPPTCTCMVSLLCGFCGALWGASFWCRPYYSLRNHSGESVSSWGSRANQEGEDVVCVNGRLLKDCSPRIRAVSWGLGVSSHGRWWGHGLSLGEAPFWLV